MGFTYVIEHMEEDEDTTKAIPEWVELEYRHMRTLAGPDALVQFSHLSALSSKSLATVFHDDPQTESLAQASAHQVGITELMQNASVPLERVCLLDPKAELELSPQDGNKFAWFLFGGILGDDPPRDRTSELRKLGFPTRHLGNVQMTTDTALGVTKRVIQDKDSKTYLMWYATRITTHDMNHQPIPVRWKDHPTITFNSKESVEMPFRYMSSGGNPILPQGMRELLHKDLDRSFDF